MIFPADSVIREYATYYIRALSIFKEEFKNSQGRLPNAFELQDFSKMGIITFRYLQTGNWRQRFTQNNIQSVTNTAKNESKPNSLEQRRINPQNSRKQVNLNLV